MRQLAEWSAGPDRGQRPPARVVRAAKAAFAQRVTPSDLAPLLWDSDTDGPAAAMPAELAGDRPRRLWFGTDGLGVELVIEPAVRGCRSISGRLVPPVRAAVALVRDSGDPVPLPLDDAGRFAAEGLAPGLLRLRSARPGRRHLLTAWVLVE